jgi:hypothetical protein
MDFIATEALTNIQLQTIEETIKQLDDLSNIPIEFHFKQPGQNEDELRRTESAPISTARSMVSYDGGQTFQP